MNEKDIIRLKVKELKWKYGISYKTIANMLDMKYNSFLNYLNGYKDLGYERTNKLKQIIAERNRDDGRI